MGRPREHTGRILWDAIQYIAATGCQWAQLPKDFPPFTVSTEPAAAQRPRVSLCWVSTRDANWKSIHYGAASEPSSRSDILS